MNVNASSIVTLLDCGGVKAALTNKDHDAPLENWLRQIRDTYRLHREELLALEPLQRQVESLCRSHVLQCSFLRSLTFLYFQRRLVELNVMEQCINLFKTSLVQKRLVETAALVKSEYEYFFCITYTAVLLWF